MSLLHLVSRACLIDEPCAFVAVGCYQCRVSFFFLVLRISLTLRVGQGADLLVHLASDVMRMSMASKFNFLCRASTIDKILGTGGSDLCLLGNQIV